MLFTKFYNLDFMQGYCPSRSAVSKFRSQAIYSEFMKQWNIGVYFSLRYFICYKMFIVLKKFWLAIGDMDAISAFASGFRK